MRPERTTDLIRTDHLKADLTRQQSALDSDISIANLLEKVDSLFVGSDHVQ